MDTQAMDTIERAVKTADDVIEWQQEEIEHLTSCLINAIAAVAGVCDAIESAKDTMSGDTASVLIPAVRDAQFAMILIRHAEERREAANAERA